MARIRTIKPEFWTDSKSGMLSPLAKCLFIGLLNHCDDCGVIEYDYNQFKACILPYEKGDADELIGGLVGEMIRNELLYKFIITDERKYTQYLHITNFAKHQTIVDAPCESVIPGWQAGFNIGSFKESQGDKYTWDFDELDPSQIITLREVK